MAAEVAAEEVVEVEVEVEEVSHRAFYEGNLVHEILHCFLK